FEEAFEATNNSKKIVEINDEGNAIKERLLPRIFSFIVNKEDTVIFDNQVTIVKL
ncbi:5289_t:CDS:2, partial [Racocetra persica]